jgi:WD40 repeat protein
MRKPIVVHILLLTYVSLLVNCQGVPPSLQTGTTQPAPGANDRQFMVSFYTPAWSPDSAQIVVVADSITTGEALMIADRDLKHFSVIAGNPVPEELLKPRTPAETAAPDVSITPRGPVVVTESVTLVVTSPVESEYKTGVFSTPVWSPKGDRIAFYYSPSAASTTRWGLTDGIYVIDRDGQNMRLVISRDHRDFPAGLSWSPDGQQLLFTSGTTREQTQVCVVYQDGAHKDCIKDIPYLSSVAWSPDGGKIAFIAGQYETDTDLYIMNNAGDNLVKITNSGQSRDMPLAFAWSPDSRRLVYSTRPSDHAPALVTVDADGANRQSIGTGFEYVDIAWSPNGQWLMLGVLSPDIHGTSLILRSIP